jgi:hypothetical protein
MCNAIDMIRKNKSRDFIILERGSQVGGTWSDNKYPGACCDGMIPDKVLTKRAADNCQFGATYIPTHSSPTQTGRASTLARKRSTPTLSASLRNGACSSTLDSTHLLRRRSGQTRRRSGMSVSAFRARSRHNTVPHTRYRATSSSLVLAS